MTTKKVYPFIHAKQCGEGIDNYANIVFDAREFESYSFFRAKMMTTQKKMLL